MTAQQGVEGILSFIPAWPEVVGMICVLCACACICVFGSPIGRALGVTDFPDGRRKRHAQPTPMVGGLAVLIPFVAMTSFYFTFFHLDPIFAISALTCAALAFVGFLDDRRDTPASIRLMVTFLIFASALVAEPSLGSSALMIGTLDLAPLIGPSIISIMLLALAGFVNAYNMTDGTNGLALGLGVIWTLAILVAAPASWTFMLVALLVCLLIVLVFNLSGRLFLGDSGSYGLGTLFAMLFLGLYSHYSVELRLSTIAVWVCIPTIDCLRLMVVRTLKGTSPFAADRNHFHHILERVAGPYWTVVIYLSMVAVPTALSLALPERSWLVLGLALSLYVIGLTFAERPEKRAQQSLPA